MTDRTNHLRIQTPEGIIFSRQLAGPVRRGLSWTVDFACVMTAGILTGQLLSILGLLSADLVQAVGIYSYFVISVGYGIVTEWFWRGQTVGKRLLRLRVVDVHGLQLQFSQIAIRNLLRVVDLLPAFYLVGGMACVLSRRAQRLGDVVGNTVVIVESRPFEPALDQLLAGKYNSFRDHPHLTARLRQRVSPAAARIALQSLLRRDDFDPPARVALFAELSQHFHSLVSFPEASVEGISDEQYIRNVVDVLFRSRTSTEDQRMRQGRGEVWQTSGLPLSDTR